MGIRKHLKAACGRDLSAIEQRSRKNPFPFSPSIFVFCTSEDCTVTGSDTSTFDLIAN